MASTGVLWLVLAGGLPIAALAQNASLVAPIPADRLEIATGATETAGTSASRAAIVRLLGRARRNYAVRGAGRAYDLKVSFTVNSGGQTEYDGAWEMEDWFDPRQGLRWTAKAAAGYAITRISRNGTVYGDETASYVPLRLHEARAALFDPIPAAETVNHLSLRTSAALFHGSAVTCILLSDAADPASEVPGRRWDETEECIDPQSGLLQTHSQVPGRYYAYDYANGPRFAGRVLPRQVTVTEGGRTVTTISIDSLTELPAADPGLFVPTGEMTAAGRPVGMGGARKISRVLGQVPGATGQTVCVFGVVAPSGELLEAHSLQPSNPNSAAAVEAVKQMNFAGAAAPGEPARQYFLFVIGTFAPSP